LDDRGTDLVADERLAGTAPAERVAYREYLRHGGGFDTHLAALIANVQQTERRSFNQPHGFWVAEAEPAAAHQSLERTLPADELATLILMTDGAAAGASDYQLAEWAGLPDELARSGVSAWLRRVHATEVSDPHGRRWPRTKRHDDKTVLELSRLAD
jgi:hypothetical protein